jgi:FkbM family methyltransferase
MAAFLNEPLESVLERERTALDRVIEAGGGRLILFGAGNNGKRAAGCLRSIGIEPLAFADNAESKWGTSIEGIPVLSPGDAAARFGADAAFIVTIWNSLHRYCLTAQQLKDLGCQIVSPPAPLFWRFSETFLPSLSFDMSHSVFGERGEIERAGLLWSDAESQAEYLAHIQWRATGDPANLPFVTDHPSYFPRDLYRFSDEEVFVDCGAFDGDTMRTFLCTRGMRFRRYHTVEANCEMWPKLIAQIDAMPSDVASRIALHECAVGAERSECRFDSRGGLGAKLSDRGDTLVASMPLDEMLGGEGATFIKMDIEGAEYGALRGARRLIERRRPVLAVCVYHSQSDIWRIPLLVESMVGDYRYYLRTYEGDGFQAVLYAVPNERANNHVEP